MNDLHQTVRGLDTVSPPPHPSRNRFWAEWVVQTWRYGNATENATEYSAWTDASTWRCSPDPAVEYPAAPGRRGGDLPASTPAGNPDLLPRNLLA